MKHRNWLLGVTLVATCAFVATRQHEAKASDHTDGTAATMAPEADITDVFTWMDGTNVVLAMNVTPAATTASKFSDKVQYVLHTASTATFGAAGTEKDVICTFDTAQHISCWIGTDDYVKGDASATTGLTSASGKVKVFAGLRDDPFFFNLDGFKATVAAVDQAAGSLTFNTAGCPALDAATSMALVNTLKTDPNSTPPGGVAKDHFAGLNVLSIVLSVDKSLLTSGGKFMTVWGSTNKGS